MLQNNSKYSNNSVSSSTNNRRWDREEVVILVEEYFRTKGQEEAIIRKGQEKVSLFLRKREEVLTGKPVNPTFRDYAGIHMQSGRIRCIDPDTKYSGMQGTKLQKQIVMEYIRDPISVTQEALQIYRHYLDLALQINL